VPSYLESVEALKEVGVDEVIVYCVNDGAVMMAWEKAQGCADEPFLKFAGDPTSALTSALDKELKEYEGMPEIDGTFGPYFKGLYQRCKRFAMYIMDGEIVLTKVSEAVDDPAGDDFPEATLAPALLEDITANFKSDPSTFHKPRDLTAVTAEVEKNIAASKVMIFSKDSCPFCKATKALFDEMGVEYTALEVNVNEDHPFADWQAALAKKTGQRTVPNVFIGGEHLGGADDTEKAKESGKLEEMLGAVSAA